MLGLDQQVPTSEGTPQTDQVQHHHRRKAPTAVEAHQLVTLIRQEQNAQPLDRRARQQGDVCTGIQEPWHIGKRGATVWVP
jgi:hypothetical protein